MNVQLKMDFNLLLYKSVESIDSDVVVVFIQPLLLNGVLEVSRPVSPCIRQFPSA